MTDLEKNPGQRSQGSGCRAFPSLRGCPRTSPRAQKPALLPPERSPLPENAACPRAAGDAAAVDDGPTQTTARLHLPSTPRPAACDPLQRHRKPVSASTLPAASAYIPLGTRP